MTLAWASSRCRDASSSLLSLSNPFLFLSCFPLLSNPHLISHDLGLGKQPLTRRFIISCVGRLTFVFFFGPLLYNNLLFSKIPSIQSRTLHFLTLIFIFF